MSGRILSPTLLIYLLCVACNFTSTSTNIISEFQGIDSCDKAPLHTYNYYVPRHSKKCKTFPLIIILSPQAGGQEAIKGFIPAAEEYKCVLVASNYIENNFEGYSSALTILIQDARAKLPISQELIISGFSGGGRMALNFGSTNKLSGVIACGALANKQLISAIHTPVVCNMGMGDFNFGECAPYLLNPNSKPANLVIQTHEGGHEWPTPEKISNSVGFILYFSNNKKDICFNTEAINRAAQSIQNKFKSDELKLIYNSLQFEQDMRNTYLDAINNESKSWWKEELQKLNNNAQQTGEKYTKYAWQRLKGFIGIVCYSATKQQLAANNLEAATKTIDVYLLAEPENAHAYYFSALLAFKKGKAERVKGLLQTSVDKGFTDFSEIEKNFPPEIWNWVYSITKH